MELAEWTDTLKYVLLPWKTMPPGKSDFNASPSSPESPVQTLNGSAKGIPNGSVMVIKPPHLSSQTVSKIQSAPTSHSTPTAQPVVPPPAKLEAIAPTQSTDTTKATPNAKANVKANAEGETAAKMNARANAKAETVAKKKAGASDPATDSTVEDQMVRLKRQLHVKQRALAELEARSQAQQTEMALIKEQSQVQYEQIERLQQRSTSQKAEMNLISEQTHAQYMEISHLQQQTQMQREELDRLKEQLLLQQLRSYLPVHKFSRFLNELDACRVQYDLGHAADKAQNLRSLLGKSGDFLNGLQPKLKELSTIIQTALSATSVAELQQVLTHPVQFEEFSEFEMRLLGTLAVNDPTRANLKKIIVALTRVYESKGNPEITADLIVQHITQLTRQIQTWLDSPDDQLLTHKDSILMSYIQVLAIGLIIANSVGGAMITFVALPVTLPRFFSASVAIAGAALLMPFGKR